MSTLARGVYKHNPSGYAYVLKGPDSKAACETKAFELRDRARAMSGSTYKVDSMVGRTRIHTRVSTSGTNEFYQERRTRALRQVTGGRGPRKTKRKRG